MDKIQKFLEKLTPKEKNEIREILLKLKKGKLINTNIKKLKGRDDIFRIRRGKIRIIYRINKASGDIFILTIERRSDKTYSQRFN